MSNDSPEVVKLASQVSEAKSEGIPSLLLQIESLLLHHREFSKERQLLKQEILKYDLLSWCAVVLKYDFSKVKGQFQTAVSLIKILSDCCIGLNLDGTTEFYQSVLPDALQSSLLIASHIQQLYLDRFKMVGSMKIVKHTEELQSIALQYQETLDSVSKLMTSQTYLVNTLLKSDNLIRLLVEESDSVVNMTVMALSMLLRGIRVNYPAVKNMSTMSRNHLLDELIYKVTTSQNDDLAAVTIKIIVAMVDADPSIANKLSTRFKGLKALMTRWMGHGFDHVLKKLIEVLDAGNAKIAELARRTHAVKTIWAAYQGWKTRTRVKKLQKVVPSLQSSFRRKRQEKLEEELSRKFEFDREHASEMSRKRSMRSAREKQLHMLEIVPARKINQHIQKEEEKAAVKVQSLWRGHMQRKNFSHQQYIYRASLAAVIIQRAVRKFLASRRKMRESKVMSLSLHEKLTTEKKEELNLKIKQWQVVRGEKETTLDEAKQIHDETQRRLLLYHRNCVQYTRSDAPRVQALIAKIHTEEEILQNAPRLRDATTDDVDTLACTSTAVIVATEKQHRLMMNELTSPWWKKLSLKMNENFDPFSDRSEPVLGAGVHEIEEFLDEQSKSDILF